MVDGTRIVERRLNHMRSPVRGQLVKQVASSWGFRGLCFLCASVAAYTPAPKSRTRDCPGEAAFQGNHHENSAYEGPVGQAAVVDFTNFIDDKVELYWVRPQTGLEMLAAEISPQEGIRQNTQVGHVFRVRDSSSALVQHYTVAKPEDTDFIPQIAIKPCGKLKPASCPKERIKMESSGSATERAVVLFVNSIPEDVDVYWVNVQGIELRQHVVRAESNLTVQSFVGHCFRLRVSSGLLVGQLEATLPSQMQLVVPCKELDGAPLVDPDLVNSYKSLIHSVTAPCEPAGHSTKYSCIRRGSFEHADKWKYGYQKRDNQHPQSLFQTEAEIPNYVPRIPKFTKGPGFLKMSMPPELARFLIQFWDTERVRSIVPHEWMGSNATNEEAVKMFKVDLDHFPSTRVRIVDFMRPMLEWWTERRLVHTATYGLRIYQRDSMLLRHVDKVETHIASAILQVAQEATEGWPLEIRTDQNEIIEIFLQPGEMLLYEGARVPHGRPMRFNGTNFVNIFTHFAPVGWHGIDD